MGSRLRGRLRNPGGTLFPKDRDPFFDAVRFGLDEVYDYKRGTTAATVAERIRDTFLEVKARLSRRGEPDGRRHCAGRWRMPAPARHADVREHLGPPPSEVAWDHPDRLIYDARFAKQRMAKPT